MKISPGGQIHYLMKLLYVLGLYDLEKYLKVIVLIVFMENYFKKKLEKQKQISWKFSINENKIVVCSVSQESH